jgi:hypothetical protein
LGKSSLRDATETEVEGNISVSYTCPVCDIWPWVAHHGLRN